MGADYSFYVKSIATYAPTFLGYNNSVLAKDDWRVIFDQWLKLYLGFDAEPEIRILKVI